MTSIAGSTVLVTGANRGIGSALVEEALARGAMRVYAGTRRPWTHTDERVTPMLLDVTSAAQISEAASGIGALDVLVNNAGIMAVPYSLTTDGFESHIGTNHLGHFALTNLLLPKLTDRVVTVSSITHWRGGIALDDLNWKKRKYAAYLAYGQSKLANLLFTRELQRRLEAAGSQLRSIAAHPGYSQTNLMNTSGRRLGDVLAAATKRMSTSADFGARQTLYAVSQDLPGDTFVGPRFGMLGRSQPVGRSSAARNDTTAAALWELSEQLTGTKFPL